MKRAFGSEEAPVLYRQTGTKDEVISAYRRAMGALITVGMEEGLRRREYVLRGAGFIMEAAVVRATHMFVETTIPVLLNPQPDDGKFNDGRLIEHRIANVPLTTASGIGLELDTTTEPPNVTAYDVFPDYSRADNGYIPNSSPEAISAVVNAMETAPHTT